MQNIINKQQVMKPCIKYLQLTLPVSPNDPSSKSTLREILKVNLCLLMDVQNVI